MTNPTKRINWKARALRAEARNKLLEELRDDIDRWREGGGDPRDVAYIFDTLEKCDEFDRTGSGDRPAESFDGCRL